MALDRMVKNGSCSITDDGETNVKMQVILFFVLNKV